MLTQFQRFVLSAIMLIVFISVGELLVRRIENFQKYKPRNTINVALMDDTPPYCFYNDQNKLVGYNIDLVREIGRRTGKKIHVESVSFNRLVAGLMTHQYDLVSMGSITPQRAKAVRYVQPNSISSDVLLVHPALKSVKSIREFRNKPWKIGVYNGSSYIYLLRERGLEANAVIYPNHRDTLLAFYKHRVDAILMSGDVALYIQQNLDPSIVLVEEKVRTNRQFALAVRKEDLKLWWEVNNAVGDMLADGTIKRLRARWIPLEKKVS